jgi:RimJ/RimL family protein N-acetyltransferase
MSITLSGNHVRVEPLSTAHIEQLAAAGNEQRDTYAYTHVPHDIASAKSYVDDALTDRAAGGSIPSAVIDLRRNTAVGSTRLFDFASWSGREFPDAAEIGHTWYAASAQRSAINTETKLLLLTHTFETWQVARMTIKTDARNDRSRNAILRLGAKFEGIRRAHQLATDGTIRDTAYYSIVATEWPAVRENLRRRLART